MKGSPCGMVLLVVAGAAVAQPVDFVDLGSLAGDGVVNATADVGEVAWLRFVVGQDVVAPTYLDLVTSFTAGGPSLNTEIGIYDSEGFLVAWDDDDGLSARSMLTFGSGSGRDDIGDGVRGVVIVAAGQDGSLAAGEYYLAVGRNNVVFGASDFNATTTSSSTVPLDFALNWYTNVPAPGAVGVLAGAGLLAVRRRR